MPKIKLRRAPIRNEEGSPKQGFVLTSGDIEILQVVLQHRFLRREHLHVLTGRHPKRLHRRLFKLERQGYLTTIRLPQQKYIYGLGRSGLQALVEEGSAPSDLLDERIRKHELSELFLKHEMMIVDIHVMLSRTSRHGAVRLVAWREGRELYDFVMAAGHRGTSRLPVRPDAFFSLEDARRPKGENRSNYSLEADRSTTTHQRFQQKLRAYWAYIEQGLHAKKLGVKGFRVLTVTLTEGRSKNLSALAVSLLPERARKYFVFASLSKLTGSVDPTGDPVCYSPRTSCSSLQRKKPNF